MSAIVNSRKSLVTSVLIIQPPAQNSLEDQQVLMLDECTGELKIVESDTISLNYADLILDDKTGKFIEKDQQNCLDINEHCDEDSTWNYEPSTASNFSESTDICLRRNEVDESSGIVTRNRRKKGQGKPQKLEKNKAKKNREQGKEYYSTQKCKGEVIGKHKRGKRKLKPGCNSKKCVNSKYFKCNEVSEVVRKELFTSFWKNMAWAQRKVLISSLVEAHPIARRTTKDNNHSRRKRSLKYTLKIGNEKVPVCKKMFLSTFSLGEHMVNSWISKCNEYGVPHERENQTKKLSAINLKKEKHVKDFIQSLPKVESHYCRQKTDKQYVDLVYTTYKDIFKAYEQYIKDKNIALTEKSSYLYFLKITHSLNIGLFKPKKDQCDLCFSFKNGNIGLNVYEQHIVNKNKARMEKDKDKERASRNEINAFTLDVQAVQLVPSIAASSTYFKQKLAKHQFTFFNLKTSEVFCFVCHEGEGGTDSNVFASCVSYVLEHHSHLSIPTVLFSDGCSAQNRNVTLANALQLIAMKYNTTIYQKYLTVGHTQMECDSVHSMIEKKKKSKEMYVPDDFVRIVTDARASKPYKVSYIDHTFFKNFSGIQFYKSIRPGIKTGDPQVTDLKCLKYNSSGMYFKLDYDNDWDMTPQRKAKIDITKNTPPLYSSSLPIPIRKYNDLQSMKRLIPRDYHSFFDNLNYV